MRIAVLADIHGNLAALAAVSQDLERQGVDRIVVAGDIATGGPQPREALAHLKALGAEMIRGNHEDYVLRFHSSQAPAGWHTSKQWAVLRWSCLQLTPDDIETMAALPAQLVITEAGCAPIRLVHGSLHSASEMLFADRDQEVIATFRRTGQVPPDQPPPPLGPALEGLQEAVLICAHTHVAWMQRENGHLIINPGAVGAPINDDVRAQYAILSWRRGRWLVEMRAVPYDVGAVRRSYVESGLLDRGGAFARTLLHDVETAQNTSWFLIAHAYQLAGTLGLAECISLPDEIWDRAVASFPWQDHGIEDWG